MRLEQAIDKAGWQLICSSKTNAIEGIGHKKVHDYRIHISPFKEDTITISDIQLRCVSLQNQLAVGCFDSPSDAIRTGEEYGLCRMLLENLQTYLDTQFSFAGINIEEQGYGEYIRICTFECSEAAVETLQKYTGGSPYERLADALSDEMEKIAADVMRQREAKKEEVSK